MIFTETILPGAYVIEPQKLSDDRGYFARIWCDDELGRHGLKGSVVQSNVGYNHSKGTLRGLHFQKAPHAEVKVLRCTRGAIFDAIVDLRPESPTYKKWFGVELTPENSKMIYVPEGFAQGYITLADHTEINYHTSQVFSPESAFGVRFDDPAFGIQWPIAATIISQQDRSWPLMES